MWEVAEELGIPVLIHFGILDGGGGTAAHVNIDPLILHPVAKAFPEVPFVRTPLRLRLPGRTAAAGLGLPQCPRRHLGQQRVGPVDAHPLSVGDLFAKFLDTVGPERVLFGSDSAHFPRGLVRAYYDSQVDIVGGLGLSASERHLVFAGNAARLLRLGSDRA